MPKILKLTPECLYIQYDASANMSELMKQFEHYHLHLAIDYEIPPHAHNTPKPNYIIVKEPSKVVRALYSIPIELWTDDLPSRDKLKMTRLHYASKLHDRNCYHFDLMFVQQANLEWLRKIHHFAQEKLQHHPSLLQELHEIAQKTDHSPLDQPIYILSLLKIHQYLQAPSLNTDKIAFSKALHQWKAHNDHLSKKELSEWAIIVQKPPVIESIPQTSMTSTSNLLNQLSASLKTTSLAAHAQGTTQEHQSTNTLPWPDSMERTTQTDLNIDPLIHELIHHRTRIVQRIQSKSWFQDLHRNQAKMAALDRVIEDYAKLPREEWILKVRDNRDALSCSTSRLPHFFRGKVSTLVTLKKIEQMLQNSIQS
jgi:hypothetical protein